MKASYLFLESASSGPRTDNSSQQHEKHNSTTFKIVLTAWAFLENILFSGLRAGWSALVYVLKQEHIYFYLCDTQNIGDCSTGSINCTINFTNDHTHILHNQSSSSSSTDSLNGSSSNFSQWNETVSTNGCKAQDAIFNKCFTVATATMALSALLYGNLNYKFGIRVPRILSVVFFVCGALCFAVIDKDVPWLIFPGLLLISSGGMALYITNNQISYLYHTGSAAVVGLLCGALEASSIVQTIIKIFYEQGISLKISYITLAALYSLTLISTIFLLPKDFISSKSAVTIKDATVTSETEFVNQETLQADGSSESIKLEKLNASSGMIVVKKNYMNHENISSDVKLCKIPQDDMPEKHNGEANSQETSQAVFCDNQKSITSTNENSEKTALDINKPGFLLQDYPKEDNSLQTKAVNGDNFHQTKAVKGDSSLQTKAIKVDSSLQTKAVKVDSSLQTKAIRGDNSLQTKAVTSLQKHTVHEENSISVSYSVNHSKVRAGNKEGSPLKHDRKNRSSSEKTLLQCLLSKTFLLYLFWAVSVQIILSMCLGTFNPWLEYVTDNDKSKVSKFTDILFYSMLGSPLLSLCIGITMDLMKQAKSSNQTTSDRRTLHTATVSLGLTSVLGVLVCAFFMTHHQDVIVVTSITLVIFRTGLYSCGTAFLRIMYPTNYFGVLCGIMSVMAGGLSFLQYPLFLWIQHRNNAWMEVFGFLGIIGIVSLTQPAYLFWKNQQLSKPSPETSTVIISTEI